MLAGVLVGGGLLMASAGAVADEVVPRAPRAREAGLRFGILQPGTLNAITDVAGVKVGHTTLVEGTRVHTGVTAILPHGGNLFQDKVPAGFSVGNGFGKFAGSTQLVELGELETPILLTNTLSVAEAMAASIEWTTNATLVIVEHPRQVLLIIWQALRRNSIAREGRVILKTTAS